MGDNTEPKLHQIEGLSNESSTPDPEVLRQRVIEKLKTVFDPEIPVDIYELGLIYKIDIDAGGHVSIEMTLTSPGCPVAGSLPGEVEARAAEAEGVTGTSVELVWDPPWEMEMMSEEAKLDLGFM